MFLVTLYRHIKDKHGQKTSFLILLAFLLSFIAARFYSILTMELGWPVLIIRDIHIHHLNFGIFFLAVSGFSAFYLSNTKFHRKIVILYGIGLGLTFDEFAMWLHLEDHYWMRTSYDAIVIISAILLNAVFFGNFWIRFFKRVSVCFNPFYGVASRLEAWFKRNIIVFAKLCYTNIRYVFYMIMTLFLLLVLWKIKNI